MTRKAGTKSGSDVSFTGDEWGRLCELLALKQRERASVREWLLRQRIEAQHSAGIEVERRRQAATSIRAMSVALNRMSAALAAVLNTDVERALGAVNTADTADARRRATGAALNALQRARTLPADTGHALQALGAAGIKPGALPTLSAEVDHLRDACIRAEATLGNPRHRPKMSDRQEAVIWRLADLYRMRTGRRPTRTETGDFAEVVRLVLRVEKAGNLVATLGRPSPSARANAAAARDLHLRLQVSRKTKRR